MFLPRLTGRTARLTWSAGLRDIRMYSRYTQQTRRPVWSLIVAQRLPLMKTGLYRPIGLVRCQSTSPNPDPPRQGPVMRMLTAPKRVWERVKWKLKKSSKPLNTDDFSALFSWLLAGNIVFLLIATTTFVSLVLFMLNTVLAQELVAEWVGNLITKNSNLTVTFENAIVPDWKDGRIQFKNCSVSKRPKVQKEFKKKGSGSEGRVKHWRSQLVAAFTGDEPAKAEKTAGADEPEDDGNYTQFDLTIEEVNISLSFKKWLDHRGILDQVSLKGMRGVIDRTHVHWAEGDSATNYKNIAAPGDWEIENMHIEDVLFTMLNGGGFRPFMVSIYNAEIPLLRQNWLMFDMMNAKHMSGAYDGSLFTINRLQRLDNFNEEKKIDSEVNAHLGREKYQQLQEESLAKITRMRIDNLKIEHLNKGMEGPMGWITKGTVDMIADVIVPKKNASLNEFSIDEIIKSYSKNLRSQNSAGDESSDEPVDMKDLFIMDFYMRLNNPKANVPVFTSDLSYVNSALIRPIVSYINSNRTFIPIRCRVYKDLADFDGSWTPYDSLLMDDLEVGVYDSLAEYVNNEELTNERMLKFSVWTLQFLVEVILAGLSMISG